jgi:hypothetical protein
MNTTAIIYIVFFSVIILLSLFVLGFFHKLKKYISINISASNGKTIRIFLIGLISLFLIGFLINNKNNSSSNSTTPDLNNNPKKTEPSLSECLQLYGNSPDMTPWELAQAECLLQQNDYKTACDCMVLLAK